MAKPHKTKYLRHTLTDPYIRGLKAKCDLQISDGAIPGLQARYSGLTGRTSFYLCYRTRGTNKSRSLHLGSYGDFSIKEIKVRVVRYRQKIFDGRDPAFDIKEQAKTRLEQETKRKKVKEIFPLFFEKYCKQHMRKSSYKYHDSNFRLYLSPIIGDLPMAEIALPQIQEIYDKVASERAVATADHMLCYISVFLNWCEKYDYRPLNSNPCRHVQKGKRKKMKYQLLDEDGYRKLFAALAQGMAAKVYAPSAFLAIKTLALTGCRMSEITDLELDELDLENNYLRLKKRKTDAFDVPLSNAAVATIREGLELCKSRRYVFHSPRDPSRPIVDLRRAFWWALDAAGLPMMRIHDLRHSFASFAASMGENLNYIEDVLGAYSDNDDRNLRAQHQRRSEADCKQRRGEDFGMRGYTLSGKSINFFPLNLKYRAP